VDREFLDQTAFARQLRTGQTVSEKVLWDKLRASKLGFKFSRQTPIGRYIADFCCRQYKVVVELDGESHDRTLEHDEARDIYLREQGYVVLRIANDDVHFRLESVLADIRSCIESQPRWRY